MRDLAQRISEELLPSVSRPGQYVGLEINARRKDPRQAEVSVAMAFPDTYSIGISHLGSQVLYHLLNERPHVACDRTYCPQLDAEAVMRRLDLPLFGWESRLALADFDILAVSLPYELCVTNVLTMLDLAGLPLRAADRTGAHPLVIGGDALADSPEPVAPFFDLLCPGDGEVTLPAVVELLRQAKADGMGRADVIRQAARTLPGVYAPGLYRPRYRDDGTLAALEPTESDVPATVEHVHVRDMTEAPMPLPPLVPMSEGVQERVILEIMRGCPNACRFCQAGHARLPVRVRPVEEILAAARAAIAATGYREISLLSLSTSDYPHLEELIDRLNAEFAVQHVSISLPSLRVDSQLRHLPRLTSGVRKGGLTIAAEAALPRLRHAIHKTITDEDMLAGVRAAYEAGWRRVKVYFIAGLPGETDEDIEAIYTLCRRLADTGKEITGHPGSISASVSWFVPKPHTPMQWSAMRDAEYFFSVRHRLRDLCKRSSVNVKFHWIERSLLEGVLARGDRRVADAIETAWLRGARMDSWDEHFDYDRWLAAFEAVGLDPALYSQREFALDEALPWSHIACPRREPYLREQRRRMDSILAEQGS